jgi:hypothetical protein
VGDEISEWGIEPFAGGEHTVTKSDVRGSGMTNVPGALLPPALAFDAVLVVGGRERFCYASSAANMLPAARMVKESPGFAQRITLGSLAKCCVNIGAGLPPGRFTSTCYLAIAPTETSLAIATMAADLFDELEFKCFFAPQTKAEEFKHTEAAVLRRGH